MNVRREGISHTTRYSSFRDDIKVREKTAEKARVKKRVRFFYSEKLKNLFGI
jgi:ribosomal protein S21